MRDIPVGNGSFLINFDDKYQIRDIYFPHIGWENHTKGYPFRFGVWTYQGFSWVSSDEWTRTLKYLPDTLVTDVKLENEKLGIRIQSNDAILPYKNIFLRRLVIESSISLRLFLHHDFRIFSSKIGDCAFYDPNTHSLIHYKRNRYFLIGSSPGFENFAIGRKAFRNLEGTWRDAEDGNLSTTAIAEGSVDSTIQINCDSSGEIYYWICAGHCYKDVKYLNEFLMSEKPSELLRETMQYWRTWLKNSRSEFADLSDDARELYKRSLLLIRTNIDNDGAILAANDSDVTERATDHYNYLWTRDGALVAYALDLAGYPSLSKKFFSFCAQIVDEDGYFLQKYNPDGTVASSWQPYWDPQLKRKLAPIQEDETALILWALWKHYEKYLDIESLKDLYRPLIIKCAEFLCEFQIENLSLPRASWNLWEDRYGIHTFTASTVIAALIAASKFAELFGESERAMKYQKSASDFKNGLLRNLYSESRQRFLRSLETRDDKNLLPDETLDASLFGLFHFDVLQATDQRVKRTMQAIEQNLWIKTEVGGVARYENDGYMRVSEELPGNPWIICTLWLANYHIAIASSSEDLKTARKLIDLVTSWALPSGVLSEQVNPLDGSQISVAPLTWSHAEFITTITKYVEKSRNLVAAFGEEILSRK